MAKVTIAFHRDHTMVGRTVDVPDEDAAVMVQEGRARYIDEPTPPQEPRKGGKPGGGEPK